MNDIKPMKSIASVLKAIEVLELISTSPNGLGVTEISNHLGFGVSATHHLLNTLKQGKMLEQDIKTKKYRMGLAIFRITGQARGQNLLGGLAMSYLDMLRAQTGETSNLGVLDGINSFCIAQSESQQMLRMFSRPGVGNPFYYTAGGKVLVANQPRETWEALINRVVFEKHTENTILSAGTLTKELELTRERGYGMDNQEREIGVICLAAPIFDCCNEVVASISISGPSQRILSNESEIISSVVGVALSFSKRLGYLPTQATVLQ